ncbi:cell division transport system ATP-binding protein [Psychrobacillus insolitus]|uniref:Cell division transport system ATP-binding protein n=1 Tax=Psychrobacillus insolitus TaxID=1461 RepID=A0A2W7PBG0_9BACI|nr:cell division transport system ATP-binding protein [Psychrobacillus insolitus]
MIHLEQVSKSFEQQPILHNINMHIAPGEFAFLQGRSGSGKSTLVKLLYRELERDTGSITIDGVSIDKLAKYELRRKMGVIFQSFELLERKTVLENIVLAGQILGRDPDKMEAEAMRLLKRVGLEEKAHVLPTKLSGGQQQRVAIVRALLNKPKIILADEPTGNLDPETASEVLMLMRELREEEGVAMLVITHSQHLIETFAEKSWILKEGGVYERQ